MDTWGHILRNMERISQILQVVQIYHLSSVSLDLRFGSKSQLYRSLKVGRFDL